MNETKKDCKAKKNLRDSLPDRNLGNFVADCDVLLGRGDYRFHPGNSRLSDMIRKKRDDYQSGSKLDKTCISMLTVEYIKQSGGRFMKRRNKGSKDWLEVTDMEARRLVVHRFRVKSPKVKKCQRN